MNIPKGELEIIHEWIIALLGRSGCDEESDIEQQHNMQQPLQTGLLVGAESINI